MKDHSILSYISQIEHNNYSDLDETMIEMVRRELYEDHKTKSEEMSLTTKEI